ncbi:MAG TPA: RNA-binding protein [Thermoplasmatales archaeon]|nr:MAG: RNA-binding protein [Thermoplasmata archaeon]KAA0017360.1 MAG: RNA-binding protein [Thermoplasmata archaeon]HHF59294.1 RNA-binding protein [Thermoplasmatales archaeon]
MQRKGKTTRELVLPSQLLGDTKKYKAGVGTFVEDGKIYAERLGILNIKDNVITVTPLRGKYEPKAGDVVVGIVIEVGAAVWMVDINAIYPAFLHINEVPWFVEVGNTSKFLNYGDVILAKVKSAGEPDKVQITLKDRGLHKINGGTLIETEPTKVPRIIGKNASMITALKRYTNCRIFVGRNGRIWADGTPEGIQKIERAIRLIEREAHTYGLTERVLALLKGE